MEKDLYDEYGNYIGPEDDSSSDDSSNYSFGNIGIGEPSESDNSGEQIKAKNGDSDVEIDNRVVLYEDKKLFPTMKEVYGDDVEIMVEEEDSMPITEPIVAPANKRKFNLVEEKIPKTNVEHTFLAGMLTKPQLIRNIAVVGALHHGKTSLIDVLVKATHVIESSSTNLNHALDTPLLYLDSRQDERERKISLCTKPISIVSSCSEALNSKSFLLNVMDTPGHSNFGDEVSVGLRLSDGVVVVVDVIEGVTLSTEKILRAAMREGLQMVLVLSKVDRLCLECRLPPSDAYFKLVHILQHVNRITQDEGAFFSLQKRKPFSPSNGNVLFSCVGGGVLSSQSIAQALLPSAQHNNTKTPKVDPFKQKRSKRQSAFRDAYQMTFGCSEEDCSSFSSSSTTTSTIEDSHFLARCLWGDVFFNSKTRTFHNSAADAKRQLELNRRDEEEEQEEEDCYGNPLVERSFVHFVLRPLWKLWSRVVSMEKDELQKEVLQPLGIKVPKAAWEGDMMRLVKAVTSRYFHDSHAVLTDAVVSCLPSPAVFSPVRTQRDFTGALTGDMGKYLSLCTEDEQQSTVSSESRLVAFVAKSFFSSDSASENPVSCLVHVLSGCLRRGQRVKVLGESFHAAHNNDDCAFREVTNLRIMQGGKYFIPVDFAPAGSWVVVDNLSDFVKKTATLVSPELCRVSSSVSILKPLHFESAAVYRVSLEPFRPSELPKILDSLRVVERVHPQCRLKVEDSGEYVLFAFGELALDVVLHEVRQVFGSSNTSNDEKGSLEVRVSEPSVLFQETVTDVSALECSSSTNDKNAHVSFIAEPLSDKAHEKIMRGFAEECISVMGTSTSSESREDVDASLLASLRKSSQLYVRQEFDFDAFSSCNVLAFGPSLHSSQLSTVVQEYSHHAADLSAYPPPGHSNNNNKNRIDRNKRLFSRCGAICPSRERSSVLINDILPPPVASPRQEEGKYRLMKRLSSQLQPSLCQSFQWVVKEGPLIEEQVRKVSFRLTSLSVDDPSWQCGEDEEEEGEASVNPVSLSAGRWVPAMRRAMTGAALLAVPRIMQPLMRGHVICANAECVSLVFDLVQRRRGQVTHDSEIPGTYFHQIELLIPALDSFGFETDLRTHTLGNAMVELWFDRYETIDSDPLDTSIQFRPLEASQRHQLGREVLLKVRRRKGLREEINIHKMFDAKMLQKLASTSSFDSQEGMIASDVEALLTSGVDLRSFVDN